MPGSLPACCCVLVSKTILRSRPSRECWESPMRDTRFATAPGRILSPMAGDGL